MCAAWLDRAGYPVVPFAEDPARAGCGAALSKPCSSEDLEHTFQTLIKKARRPGSA
jgi:hypothetical protein